MANDSLERKLTILIADDNEINREILRGMLEGRYNIVETTNGRETLDYIHSHPDEVDLLLLDFIMPEMDGMKVLFHMQMENLLENIPTIMISAANFPGNIERAYILGATDYISRPFDMAIVQRRVNSVMKLHLKQKQLNILISDQIREKHKISDMMVHILSGIVEFRNGESGQHVLHIRLLTEYILKSLPLVTADYDLTQEQIYIICMGAAMHDIGKISVPSKILNKPGKLTPEEFEIMKSHTTVGAQMLEQMDERYASEPFVRTAYEIVRWHHERYDGNGYPDGLKGDEIPISAQVVSLADVYDALTSERCYKKAIPHLQAIQMIEDEKCGVFNPLLLQCLEKIQDDIPFVMQHGVIGEFDGSDISL